jgi:hypothetical protein
MPPMIAEDPVAFTCVLDARCETVDFLARLLHQRRCVIGTRSGTRVLGPFKQAVFALRWFLDKHPDPPVGRRQRDRLFDRLRLPP